MIVPCNSERRSTQPNGVTVFGEADLGQAGQITQGKLKCGLVTFVYGAMTIRMMVLDAF